MTRGYSICKRCERFFKQNDSAFCGKCHDIMSKNGKHIRSYLEQNPGAAMMDISMDLNIPMKNINLFLENQGSFLVMREEEENEKKEKSIEKENEIRSKKRVLMSKRRRR